MTVRKNFLFDEVVADHLKELSVAEEKSMTAVVAEMIEEKYKEIEKQKKLAAFNRMTKSIEEAGPNPLWDEIDVNTPKLHQKIKSMME